MITSKIIASNMLWRFSERFGAKTIQFLVEIVLARLLLPEEYGTIALITIFITILQVFVDSGLGNALIQKKNADDLDFSTVFYVNMGMCLILYLLIFLCAPLIASFYHDETLIPLIRVLSITIIISGLKNVQQAYVSRHMLFKRFFFSTLGGTIASAIVGITMAYFNFGVWALVAQMLMNTTIDTLILWFTVKWRPKKVFSFDRLKSLFSFGWKLLLSGIIDTVYGDLRQLIIGRLYKPSDLAQFNQGKKWPMYFVININTSIDSVLFPMMSESQDDIVALKKITRRAIKTSTYVIMPFMVGFSICADSLVSLILTDKWLPCVPFLRICCLTYAFHPIHTANLNAIKGLGRSDLFLKLEIIKKIIGLITIVFSMQISVMAMAWSSFITSIISQIINSWPNKKLMNYSYLEQVRDMLPQILLSLGMGGIVYCVQFIKLNAIITLLIQIPAGVMIYWLGSKTFHIDSYEYVINTVKELFHKYKKEA